MEQLDPLRPEHPPRRHAQTGRWRFSIVIIAVAAVLLFLVLRAEIKGAEIPRPLLAAVVAGFGAVILVGTWFLVRALRQYRESEERFQQMATNIREIFWMIDAETKRALYVNEAYETITGRSCHSLMENPTSYEDLIHPEDRGHVLAKLEEATHSGQFDERFRILCAHGEVRWVKVHGFPVRDHSGEILRLVGTAQEITAQKQAEDQVVRNLAKAESAWGGGRRTAYSHAGAHPGLAHGFRHGHASEIPGGDSSIHLRARPRSGRGTPLAGTG